MWLLCLLGVLTVITVVCGVFAFLLTKNRKYLVFSWQVFRYALVVALLVFALLIVERLAIIPV